MTDILKTIAALGTMATGLFSLIKPLSVRAFTGLEVAGSRGITEICAVLGGFIIALGAAPLLFRNPDMLFMLGFACFGVAIVRAVFTVIDKSLIKSNYISLATEVILGIILVLSKNSTKGQLDKI